MVVSPKDTSRESKNDRKSLKRSEQESKIRRRTTYSVVLFAALFFTDIKNLRISTEIFFVGERAGIRTRDPLIKSQMLYQLSYAPKGQKYVSILCKQRVSVKISLLTT